MIDIDRGPKPESRREVLVRAKSLADRLVAKQAPRDGKRAFVGMGFEGEESREGWRIMGPLGTYEDLAENDGWLLGFRDAPNVTRKGVSVEHPRVQNGLILTASGKFVHTMTLIDADGGVVPNIVSGAIDPEDLEALSETGWAFSDPADIGHCLDYAELAAGTTAARLGW